MRLIVVVAAAALAVANACESAQSLVRRAEAVLSSLPSDRLQGMLAQSREKARARFGESCPCAEEALTALQFLMDLRPLRSAWEAPAASSLLTGTLQRGHWETAARELSRLGAATGLSARASDAIARALLVIQSRGGCGRWQSAPVASLGATEELGSFELMSPPPLSLAAQQSCVESCIERTLRDDEFYWRVRRQFGSCSAWCR